MSTTEATSLVRVEKGRASDEEVAAVTAILLARAAGSGTTHSAAGHRPTRTAARWRRLERTPGFRAPHSWQL